VTPQRAAKLVSDFIVTSRQETLCGPVVTNGIAGDEFWRQFFDDCLDHQVQLGGLVVQLKIAACERFEADPISGFEIAVGGKIRPGRHKRADQLHPALRQWHLGLSATQLFGR